MSNDLNKSREGRGAHKLNSSGHSSNLIDGKKIASNEPVLYNSFKFQQIVDSSRNDLL